MASQINYRKTRTKVGQIKNAITDVPPAAYTTGELVLWLLSGLLTRWCHTTCQVTSLPTE